MSQRKRPREHIFGRWTAIGPAIKRGRTIYWFCQCECGTKKFVTLQSLRNGGSRSCGCLKKDEPHIKHGAARNARHGPGYNVWRSMKRRCLNKKNSEYHLYGGRGIMICARWIDSYSNFIADMGPRPSPTHSIDRINNNGHYTPLNCRWATRTEQNRNRRNTRMIEVGGKTLPLAEACERYGVPYQLAFTRIHYRKWPVAKALGLP